ncbi:MAG: hypothetical protein NVV72_18455 [Asticcacaulis sp.]|nr:hypothetical protein [Asticcacaulis sp.]
MTEHPENPPENVLVEGKAAYVKAQKKRNLYIGLALAAFVVLVFFISMARMSQGIRHDAENAAEARASVSGSH